MNQTSHLLFAASAPGLEPLLLRELGALGFAAELREGGVEFRATAEGLYRVALHSALAENVRVRLKSFVARDFDALKAGLSRLPWRAYLAPGQTVVVRAVCHRSKLWHSGAVEERAAEVLAERVGARLESAVPEQGALIGAGAAEEADESVTIFVRITGDAVQTSIDATGRMHRRGYRAHVERASLRETLAAALVQAAAEATPDRPTSLWDPFCGAGTVALEAARHFDGRAPGISRRFPFEKWPTHQVEVFAAARSEAAQVVLPAAPARIFGSDISERALEASRHNAKLLGVELKLVHADFEEAAQAVPRGAWVVSNPPYGERLEGAGLMKRFDALLQRRRDLRPVVLLVGGLAKKELSGRFRSAYTTKNGGLDVGIRVLTNG